MEAEKKVDSRFSRHQLVTFGFIAAAVALIGILAIGLVLDPEKVPSSQILKNAMPFKVAWLQGHDKLPSSDATYLRLADFRDSPVIVNFWASWCVSCRQEAHQLEQFWQKHGHEVKVVGIAIQDTREAAMAFAREFGKTYLLALDEDGKASIDYGVSGVPETFFIDRLGVIRHKEVGPVNVAMLERLLPEIMTTTQR